MPATTQDGDHSVANKPAPTTDGTMKAVRFHGGKTFREVDQLHRRVLTIGQYVLPYLLLSISHREPLLRLLHLRQGLARDLALRSSVGSVFG